MLRKRFMNLQLFGDGDGGGSGDQGGSAGGTGNGGQGGSTGGNTAQFSFEQDEKIANTFHKCVRRIISSGGMSIRVGFNQKKS